MSIVRPSKSVVCALTWLLLMSGGIWRWTAERGAARAAAARVEALEAERTRLLSFDPPLDAIGEQVFVDALAADERRLAALRDKFAEETTTSPATALDVFFDLSNRIEQLRSAADRAGIALSPDECFGFATYRREPPAASEHVAVRRQLAGLRPLLAALIEARPRAILAVQRERPTAVTGDAADFFAWDSARSLRRPGVLDAAAFRVEFTGRTPALRAFLGRLADARVPLVVRNVEVTPVVADPEAPTASGDGTVTVVSTGWSRFVVIVEHLAAAPAS